MAEDVLGRRPSFPELYGVEDRHALDEDRRGALFAIQCVGRGERPPTGALNARNALFMTNSINGLDDLVFIVMFGARPYAVAGQGPPDQRRADRDAIFASQGPNSEILACRHADPAAALGAQDAVWQGRVVAFADPLGMYHPCPSTPWAWPSTAGPSPTSGSASAAEKRGSSSGSRSGRPAMTRGSSTTSRSRSGRPRSRSWAGSRCSG